MWCVGGNASSLWCRWWLAQKVFGRAGMGHGCCLSPASSWQTPLTDHASLSCLSPSQQGHAVLSHFSCVWFFEPLWTIACQPPLSVGFSSWEYWSGLPCPPPGRVLRLLLWQAGSLPLAPPGKPWFSAQSVGICLTNCCCPWLQTGRCLCSFNTQDSKTSLPFREASV